MGKLIGLVVSGACSYIGLSNMLRGVTGGSWIGIIGGTLFWVALFLVFLKKLVGGLFGYRSYRGSGRARYSGGFDYSYRSSDSTQSSSSSSRYDNSTVSYTGQESSYLTGTRSTNYEEIYGTRANSAYNVKTLQDKSYPYDNVDVKQATIANYDFVDSNGNYWKKV